MKISKFWLFLRDPYNNYPIFENESSSQNACVKPFLNGLYHHIFLIGPNHKKYLKGTLFLFEIAKFKNNSSTAI